MEKQLKLFLDFLKNEKKASENTLQSYRRDIVYYGKYLEANEINFAKIQEDDIKKYLEYMQKKKKKGIYNLKKFSFNSFFLPIFNEKQKSKTRPNNTYTITKN